MANAPQARGIYQKFVKVNHKSCVLRAYNSKGAYMQEINPVKNMEKNKAFLSAIRCLIYILTFL